MITSFITFIENILIPLGGPGIFFASILEEVLAPIPSPFVQMAAGFFLLPESVSAVFFRDLVFQVVLPASLGVALGSLVVYYIGYYSGKPALVRWGYLLGLKWDDVEQARLKFRKRNADSSTLFVLRALPIVPSVAIAAVAGIIRMPVTRYLVYSFLGTCVRVVVLGLIGWKAGELYREYSAQIDRFEGIAFGVVGIAVAFYILYRLVKRRFRKQQ